MAHLARDALPLRDNDVLLPQSLLQPLGSQHRLAGLQSCCNAKRAAVGTAGAAGSAGCVPEQPLPRACPNKELDTL